jgi:uncharacterized repeat protein (TIGR02543 family)
MGWFADEEYTVEVTSTTTVTDTNNHTIYAKWEVETNAPVVEETDKKSIDGTTIALIVAGAIIVALAVVFLVVKIKKSKNASRKKHIVINSINTNKK